VRTWCADNQTELIFLPTCGSWPNWIEAEFAALRYFSLGGSDHRSDAEQSPRHQRVLPRAQRLSRTQDGLRHRLGHPHLDPLSTD
jgi:hypothetical protein